MSTSTILIMLSPINILCIVKNNATLRESEALLFFTPFVFVKLIVETELLEWSGVEWSEAKSRNNCAL